jgi:hypothetical protein
MENLYDEIVITLVKDGKPNGQIRMQKESIEALEKSHGQSTGEVMEMMLQTLVEEAEKKEKTEKS